ncbi:sensor histidine kinase [Nocardiopsis alba]|uniref:sensor histidine kinase n=1 Tax=Nocardiopsis alba TaxID=53437 RepID=UPI0033AAAB34
MRRDAPALPEAPAETQSPPLAPTSRMTARFDAALTRAGFSGAFGRDLLLGVFVALVSVALLYSVVVLARAEETPFAPAAVAVLVALTVVQSLTLCLRRRVPLLCLSIVVAAQIGMTLLLPADATFQGLAPFIAAYTCGTALSLKRFIRVLVTIALVFGVCGAVFALPPLASLAPPALVTDPVIAGLSQVVSAVLVFGVAGLVGNDVSMRRRYVHQERIRLVERERERVNGALRAERTRMARELHDIAAHHLSGMVVQAGAAEKLADRDAPALAPTIGWIRRQGKETLENLRMVVGALRDPGEYPDGGRGEAAGESDAPVPGVAVLDRLVETERELGVEVSLKRSGPDLELPPVADVMFYRVAQEALANARDHAWGAPVRVELARGEREVELRVDNDPGAEREEGAKASRGLGLIGMRERADLVGATLETGPTETGGWSVRLVLPLR